MKSITDHLGIRERWMPDEEENAIKKQYENRDDSKDPAIADELAKLNEDSAAYAERMRVHPRDAEEYRPGEILHQNEVLRRLRRIDSSMNYNNYSNRGLVGIYCMRHGLPTYCNATVQVGMCPEFDLVRLDDHGMAKGFKYRGWRSMLLALIRGGFITEDEAHREFGKPGVLAANYKRELFDLRNRKFHD
jgi:hypothetical protein